jgi:light-regulated signal transduction histidine kinase (bacteriophytochrome)
MEEQKDMSGMLEMVPQPAFCVKNGFITLVNQAAGHLLIEVNTPVDSLLGNDAEEYRSFNSGCLYLTLELSGCPYHANVKHFDDFDLFVIDHETDQAELQAMALTATEIREPISDIMAVTDLLFPSGEIPDDPGTQANLARMNQRLNQLNRMLCNMSCAIQYTSNTPARMTCQDVCAVIAEIFEQAQVLVAATGIQLTYSGPREEINCMIAADRLERAIYNILSNSMKHCSPGDLIEAKLTRRDNKLYLSIQDNGSGIPSQMLGNVFTRFRRAPALDSSSTGLGLGMVLVRGAAATHGGTVLVNQPAGGGTRVTMSIAIKKANGSAVRSPILNVDYAGEHDHGLMELSDVLPLSFYYKS